VLEKIQQIGSMTRKAGKAKQSMEGGRLIEGKAQQSYHKLLGFSSLPAVSSLAY
jgi:hypothetical protein